MTSSLSCLSATTATAAKVTMISGTVPASVTASASATSVCSGSPTTFTAAPVNGGVSPTYQWYKNNQAITGATSQTYTVTQNGAYYAAVTDNNSCVNNSDTVNITNVGVETVNNNKNAVTVYPNPAQDVVYISAPVVVNVTIRNINGQIVFAENNVHSADISKLANGLYMIFVADEKGQLLLTEKLMKNP